MRVKSVAIFGDSWAAKSFKKLQQPEDMSASTFFSVGFNLFGAEAVGRLTFQQLFGSNGIVVDNFSKSGCSNTDIVVTLKKRTSMIHNSDLILICQTDPLRDFCMPNAALLIDEQKIDQIKHYENLNDFTENLCKNFYDQLSAIQEQLNKPFLLFTGCSKLCEKYIPTNINYLLPCWTGIVDKRFKPDQSIYYDTWQRPLLFQKYLMKKFNLHDVDSMKNFFKIEEMINYRTNLWKTNENFGWAHPGDGAYQIMFDTLIKYIGELDDRSQTSN